MAQTTNPHALDAQIGKNPSPLSSHPATRMCGIRYIDYLISLLIYLPIFYFISFAASQLGPAKLQHVDVVFALLGSVAIFYRYGVKTLAYNLKSNTYLYVLACMVALVVFIIMIDSGDSPHNSLLGYRIPYFVRLDVLLSVFLYLCLLPYHRIGMRAVVWMLLLGSLAAAFSIMFYYYRNHGGISFIANYNRIIYANMLAAPFTLALALGVFLRASNTKWLAMIAASIYLISILAVQSRGIIVPCCLLAFIYLIYVLFFDTRLRDRRALKGGIFAMLAICLLIGGAISYGRISYSIYEITKARANAKTPIYEVAHPSSMQVREVLWHVAYDLVRDEPELLWHGIGRNLTNHLDELYRAGVLKSSYFKGERFAHFHNLYLDFLIRYGLPGVVLLVLYIIAPCFLKTTRIMKLAIYGAVFVILLCFVTDAPLVFSVPLLMHMSIFSLMVGYDGLGEIGASGDREAGYAFIKG